MSVIFKPELVISSLEKFGDEDRKNLLLAYHAACLEANCPKSDELTHRIAAIAAGISPAKEATVVAELSEQELAISILLKSGVNPFSGKGISPTTPVTDTSVRIPDSYIGKKYENQEGLFWGYDDLGDGKGEQPIFVLGLTDTMTFNQTVAATGKLENGYKADPLTYDAMQGLREGKTVIATQKILKKIHENKNKGEFKKLFKDVGWVLSSSPHPDTPHLVRLVDFRDGDDYWYNLDYTRAPIVLVRVGLTL